MNIQGGVELAPQQMLTPTITTNIVELAKFTKNDVPGVESIVFGVRIRITLNSILD